MKILLFIYQWLIAMPILLIATVLTAILTALGSICGFDKWWGYYPAHFWAMLFCTIMFVRVKVTGRENINKNTSYVFIANHQGAYDIFSIYGYLNHNFKWMMKKSLEKIPLVGYACKKAGHIMVDRSSSAAIKSTLDGAKHQLKDGMSIVVFPEGARSWTGKMRAFKRGAFKLAVDFELPIVPITIDGSFKVLPRTTYNITPNRINITIHQPIIIKDAGHNLEDVMKNSFEIIQSSLPIKDRNV